MEEESKPLKPINPEFAQAGRFDNLDNMATGDHKGERMGQVKAQYLAAPTNANWYDKNVGVPQRFALFTMFCILAYEALVFASMGVRKLRWAMVNWLMYLMLALNVALMICLAAFVYIRKKDYGITALTDIATGRGLWSPAAVFAVTMVTLLTLFIGDYMASKVIVDHTRFSVDEDDGANSIHINRHHQIHEHHNEKEKKNEDNPVRGAFFSVEMPNFWIWYTGNNIIDVIRSQQEQHLEFAITTVYNAVWSTNVVFVWTLCVSMTLAIRAFTFDQSFRRRWVSPMICSVAFLFDFLEDVFLLLIVFGFPHTEYPTLLALTPYMSFFKFVSWFLLLLWWLTMGFIVAVKPPEHIAKE